MNFTMYTMLGIVGGLGLSLLAFQKWNLPGYCRKRFKLNTRVKMLIFTLVTGFVLALLLSMVMDMIGISGVAHEIISGSSIGFNCALLAGIMRDNSRHKESQKNIGKTPKGNSRRDGSGGRRNRG